MALIIFRQKKPELERKFRVPFYPVTPILGIGMNLFLICNLAISDRPALIIAVSVIGAGIIYYYIVMPRLKYASKGISIVDVPEIKEQKKDNRKNEIVIPVSNPNTADGLLNFGRTIALSRRVRQLFR